MAKSTSAAGKNVIVDVSKDVETDLLLGLQSIKDDIECLVANRREKTDQLERKQVRCKRLREESIEINKEILLVERRIQQVEDLVKNALQTAQQLSPLASIVRASDQPRKASIRDSGQPKQLNSKEKLQSPAQALRPSNSLKDGQSGKSKPSPQNNKGMVNEGVQGVSKTKLSNATKGSHVQSTPTTDNSFSQTSTAYESLNPFKLTGPGIISQQRAPQYAPLAYRYVEMCPRKFAIEKSQSIARKMFRLNGRVSKRRSELLSDTLQQILLAFARRQDQITRCFLPVFGIEFKDLYEGLLSNEEKRYLADQLALRGFTVSFRDEHTPAFKGRSYSTPEKRCTSLQIISCDFNLSFEPTFQYRNGAHSLDSDPMNKRGNASYECLTAKEWRAQQEQYAFSWLFGTLNERVSNCNAGRDLFEFDLFIPLHYDSKVEYSNEARLDERVRLFSSPIKWANLLSCYRLELRDYCTIKVVYKNPREVEQAEDLNNTLLFSSLLCIDRVQDEKVTDWRNLPLTAFKIVFRCLLNKDVLSLQTTIGKRFKGERTLMRPSNTANETTATTRPPTIVQTA